MCVTKHKILTNTKVAAIANVNGTWLKIIIVIFLLKCSSCCMVRTFEMQRRSRCCVLGMFSNKFNLNFEKSVLDYT